MKCHHAFIYRLTYPMINTATSLFSNGCSCCLAGPDSLDVEPSLLTSAQAMADYAFLIQSFKADHKAESSAVIAFGGSYGGMVRRSGTVQPLRTVSNPRCALLPCLLLQR